MKKKSIASLKAAGWNLPPDEQKKVERHQFRTQMDANAERIVKAVESIKGATAGNTARLETLVVEQTKAIGKLTQSIVEHRANKWEFDVQRNKSGFISKVYAKRTD